MKNRIKTLVAILICAVPGVAAADPIVFENAYEDGEHVAGTAWCSGCGENWRVWDNFTVSDETEITQIDARVYLGGSRDPDYLIEFSVWMPNRSGLLFSQVLAVADLSVKRLSGGTMQSDLFANMTGWRLSPGEYALSIWDMAKSGSYFAWYATSKASNGVAYQSLNGDGTGYLGGGTNEEMAFRLHGNTVSVPEPGTLTLLGLGLAGIGYSRRRKA